MLDKSKPVVIGFSGGADSVAAYHFLKNGGWNVKPLFINHYTKDCAAATSFIENWIHEGNFCYFENIEFVEELKSKEEYWRNERLRIFKKWKDEGNQVITAHHLNDAVETWLFTSFHGQPKLPKWDNGVVKRPFLLTKKPDFVGYCLKHKLKWVEDKSNYDFSHPRNRIRHETIKSILQINPGLEKVIYKKLESCR